MVTPEIKGAIIGAGATLIVGVATIIITVVIYNDQKLALVETMEQATVEKLSGIYENVTKDMSYEEAFKIVFEDSERAKKEKNELIEDLDNIKKDNDQLKEDLKVSNDELNSIQKYIEDNQADVDRKIEEQAKEYAASGNYLRALVELKGIVKITPSIELIIKEYTQQYEANVIQEVNEFIINGKLDEANKLVNEGLKYIPDSQILDDLQQQIEDSQSQKMLDVAAKSQSGGDTYEEYTIITTGGAGFSMGGDKYTDGMKFRTMNGDTWATYPLKSKYNKLNFILGHVDNSKNDGGTELKIFYYNREIEEYVLQDEIKLSSDMPPREISLNVSGLDYIKFQFSHTGRSSWYGIGNPILQ